MVDPKDLEADASQIESVEGILDGRSEDLNGYIASFISYLTDMDPAPLFQGLPDDRCQCPHWGYVIKGKMTFRFADREETYEAGDAYYAPPGHTPVMFAGAEVVELPSLGPSPSPCARLFGHQSRGERPNARLVQVPTQLLLNPIIVAVRRPRDVSPPAKAVMRNKRCLLRRPA